MKNSPFPGAPLITVDELLTAQELADRLHIRPRTVMEWSRRGRIPAVRLSAKILRFDWCAVLGALRKADDRREATHVDR